MNRIPFIIAYFSGPKGKKPIFARAIVDTGASITVIPTSFATELGLQEIGKHVIRLIDKNIEASLYRCIITVKDVSIFANVMALDQIENPIIGMDIIKEKVISEVFIPQIFSESINILQNIADIKQNTVLIIGQDTTEINRLRVIKERLSYNNYVGIIVKDISDIEIQSIEEKVNMLASLCRFVICENTVASGHIDELKICANNRFVTAILQEEGRGATWMQSDYNVDYSFMKTFYYPSLKEINPVVDAAIEWAEQKIDERRLRFNDLYKWRKKPS